jgi:hypothetical protein
MYHPDLFPVRPINTENPVPACRHAEVEKPRLHREPRRVRQQLDRERIFKRLFHFPLSQRTNQFKGRIIPIKLHFELFVCNSPMQCLYNVFTHDIEGRQRFCTEFLGLQLNCLDDVSRALPKLDLILTSILLTVAAAQAIHQVDQRQEHRDDDAADDDSQEDDHDGFEQRSHGRNSIVHLVIEVIRDLHHHFR